MSRWKLWFGVAVLAAALLSLSGCAAGPNPLAGTPGPRGVAGFWMGLWHGFIVFFTLVISVFDKAVKIYEVHNTGLGYDIGFVLGAMSSLGGAGRGSHRRR